MQAKGTSLLATLDKWHEKADGNCAIDYGFHMIVSDVNETTLKEMDACVANGATSFKMFMAYPACSTRLTGRSCWRCSRPRGTAP